MGLTSHKEGLPVLGALRWLVPKGLHVMRGPLGLAKITRHVLVEVSRSLGKNKQTQESSVMSCTGNSLIANKLKS